MYIIKIKKQNHFFNLLEDIEFAQGYFLDKGVENFNNSKLNKLQDDLRKTKRRYSRMSSVLSITQFLKLENRVNIASKLGIRHQELEDSVHDLEIFESNLAYLIFSESISVDDCCKKNNLDPVYLRNLLEKYKKQAYVVKNEIDEKREKQNQQDDSLDDEILNRIDEKIQSFESDNRVQVKRLILK